MPDTRSLIARRWPELAWGAFAAANVGVMLWLDQWQTVPFHFVWVSLTILYHDSEVQHAQASSPPSSPKSDM